LTIGTKSLTVTTIILLAFYATEEWA